MIGDMDFIEKYLLETILHEQEIHQLLNEKKLQTQEVQSNTIQASNVNSVVMENTCSEKENSNSDTAFNNHKALDASLVVIESSRTDSEVHDESTWSGNDTDVDDVDIRPIYDEEPMDEVQFTAKCNVFAIGKQHAEKPEIINEGRVDQDVVQCQENKTLKKHNKELYDSIKTTRAKTIEQTTSLIGQNVEFKAQLPEKGFAIAALKNELRKLTGNSVNTKFAKPSILGKPLLQPLRNQSRQPNAFKSERPKF
ncbi:hypothetical protein Tco_1080700 [Tanacetum coccineum]|uniref:Uncharacterized protein n=1 Tax=Tanacetum coccineum TaxID=301880 RepID=A0ABQ5HVH6_9ASTR